MHRTALKSQWTVLGGHLTRLVLAVAITALLGRHLSPGDFGFAALVGATLAIQLQLMEFGAGPLVIRELAQQASVWEERVAGYLSFRTLVGIAGALVLLGLLLTVSGLGRDRQVVLSLVAVSLPLLGLAGVLPLLEVQQRFGWVNAIRTLAQSLVLGGVWTFFQNGIVSALVALWLPVRELVSATSIFLLARATTKTPIPWSVNVFQALEHLRRSWRLGVLAVFQLGYFYSDLFLVRMIRGQDELGAYASAFRPLHVLVVVPGLLLAPLLPILARYAKHQRRRYRLLIQQLSAFMGNLGVLGIAAALPAVAWSYGVLYGEHYQSGPLNALPAFRWLLLSLLAIVAGASSIRGLIAESREHTLLWINLIGFLGNLVANLLLIPWYGFLAAAITTALTEVWISAAAMVLVARRGRFRWVLLLPSWKVAGLALVALLCLDSATGLWPLLAGAGALVSALSLAVMPKRRLRLLWRELTRPREEIGA